MKNLTEVLFEMFDSHYLSDFRDLFNDFEYNHIKFCGLKINEIRDTFEFINVYKYEFELLYLYFIENSHHLNQQSINYLKKEKIYFDYTMNKVQFQIDFFIKITGYNINKVLT